MQEQSKNRKSEAQERFEVADNNGRFAGNDADAQSSRQQALENVRQDKDSSRRQGRAEQNTDEEARRDPAQTHDYKEEAQNVNDDTGRPMSPEEVAKARNKANEGRRQERTEG